MMMGLIGPSSVAAGGGLDPATTAWIAAVIGAGGTVSGAQQTRVDTLVLALKAHSLFSIQDRIWLHASENAQQATIDIVNLGVATPVNSPTFTASQGYTGDGASSYLDTNVTLSSLSNHTVNNGGISTYVRNNRTSDATTTTFGASDGTNASMIFPKASGLYIYDVNNAPFGGNNFTVSSSQGFWTSVRTGAAAAATYKNSSSTAVNTQVTLSTAVPTVKAFILARNNNGSTDFFSADQVAITAIGAAMTNGTNVAQFQTDLNAYMTSLGTNVY